MGVETVNTLVVGAGQAGLAMSAHLKNAGVDHVVLERHRIAERWRTERWDSLVANGPAWHDRFPAREFEITGPDGFAPKEEVASYFEAFAKQIDSPIRCGVEVMKAEPLSGRSGYLVETSDGTFEAANVVVATGPFQKPVIPTVVPEETGITQIHSSGYKNPEQIGEGAVLVVGAGSSGAQIADELLRAGRDVYLSIGPHDRPPRRYRGKDFVWWLGVLGKWGMKTPNPGTEHVTISVSGAYGGKTVDFRKFAARGMTLLGRTQTFEDGALTFSNDLAENLANGDANYLSVLEEGDAYIAKEGLDFPEEPEAKIIDPDPECVTNPILSLDLEKAGIGTIIWATGFATDFSWLKVDTFDEKGRPRHTDGVCDVPGLYFIGLPWLSCRGSAFIWGVWNDAEYLAGQIAGKHQAEVA